MNQRHIQEDKVNLDELDDLSTGQLEATAGLQRSTFQQDIDPKLTLHWFKQNQDLERSSPAESLCFDLKMDTSSCIRSRALGINTNTTLFSLRMI